MVEGCIMLMREGLEIDIKDEQLKNGSVSWFFGNSGFYSRGQGVVKRREVLLSKC